MKRLASGQQKVDDIPDFVIDNIRTLLQKKHQTFKKVSPTAVVNQNQLVPPSPLPTTGEPKIEPASTPGSVASSARNTNGVAKRGPDTPMSTFSESVSDDASSICSLVVTTPQNQYKLDVERGKIQWIPKDFGLVPLTFSNLIMERGMAPEQPAMYIDCTYAERKVLEQLMDAKGRIKNISAEKFAGVRNCYNEFEFERGAIFHHGAAIKMANIDALMEYGLSNPRDRKGTNLIGPNELLYFVDVYGGPGGCAEYFLWKKKWHAKGFGISPRGKLDYNLLQAEHYPRESFEPYYGEDGIQGTGDISNPFNVSRFGRFVRDSTGGVGAHFCVGSAGDRNDYVDEDQKEVRCKYLFMAELLCALQVVRQGGHYVCRIYDCYTPFTVGLIYLMYRCFEEVAIFKPESSLPASSERYIICKWKRPDHQTREIVNYLSDCHKVDWLTKRNRRSRNNEDPADIVHLVSRERIKTSRFFCDYIYHCNSFLGRRQYDETTYLLNKMERGDERQYVNDRLRQIQIRCNEQWQIPLECRQKPKYSRASTADLRAMKLVIPYSFEFYRDCGLKGEMDLNVSTLKEEITNSKEWFFITAGRTRGFFLSLGGSQNYQFGGAKWNEVNAKIELMNNTLVYADLVDEIIANGANQSITTGFHIIDALILGGNDIRNLAASERYDLIRKYAKSMNKISRPDLAKIRAKPRYTFDSFIKHMESVREESERIYLNDGGPRFLAPVKLNSTEATFYCAEGIVFMKSTKENFAPADALYTLMNRFLWTWTSEVDLKLEDNGVGDSGTGDGDVEMEEDEDKKENVTTTILSKYFATLP